jgi:3-hydroxyacyl-CoA dehydrogenase
MKVSHVALVGTGVIGASWATLFLAKGLDVIATDTAPEAETKLRSTIARQWPAMETLGLAPGAAQKRLTFTTSLKAAVRDADFIQESGPERLEIKRSLYRAMDEAARPDVVIATSSSGILISEVQVACPNRPDRVLVGHPFNPPHLIPLVEVVGGKATSDAAIATAMAFYSAVGKHPIHLKKEVKGHVANRLQAALWREAFALVRDGVASVADIDAAVAHGPGLRWALLGPFLNLHLSGGVGGLEYVLDHLGPPIESWWADMTDVTLDDDLKAKLVAGGDEELAGTSMDVITRDRDRVLLELMRLKSEAEHLP